MGYYTYFNNHDTKLDRNLTEIEKAEFDTLNANFNS